MQIVFERNLFDRETILVSEPSRFRDSRGVDKKAQFVDDSSPVKFVITFLLFSIFSFLVIERYLPGNLLIGLDFLFGNQVIRLLSIPLLVVISLLVRRKNSRLFMWGISLTLILIVESALLLPRPKAVDDDSAKSITLMSFNAATGHLDYLLDHLQSANIDLACISEAYQPLVSDLSKTAKDLGYNSHFTKLRSDAGMGLLILTRGIIDTVYEFDAESFDANWRQILALDLTFDESTFRLIPVHLESSDRKNGISGFVNSARFRRIQADLVSSIVDTSSMPIIVSGDFNATPTERSIYSLRRRLKDAWISGGKGIGGTWPSARPFLRIDAVLTRGMGTTSPLNIYPLGESDHLAIQTEIGLP